MVLDNTGIFLLTKKCRYYPIPPWRKKNPYCREGGIVYYRHFLKKKSLLSRGWYWIIPTFHFHLITMIIPWAWRGGIADYHPNPEGLGNTLRTPERSDGGGGYCPTPKDEDGNQQYLRAMLTVLSLSLGENEMSVISNTTLSTIGIFFLQGGIG